MPPLDSAGGGYLRRVLANGARMPQVRSAVRALLGGSETGTIQRAGVAPLAGFKYAHRGNLPLDANIGVGAQEISDTLTTRAVQKSPAAAREPDMLSRQSGEARDHAAPTHVSELPPAATPPTTAHAEALALQRAPAAAPRANPAPPVFGSEPTIAAVRPAAQPVSTLDASRVARADQPTGTVEGITAIRPGPAPGEFPPAMRALLPFLGRIRIAGDTPEPPSMHAQSEPAGRPPIEAAARDAGAPTMPARSRNAVPGRNLGDGAAVEPTMAGTTAVPQAHFLSARTSLRSPVPAAAGRIEPQAAAAVPALSDATAAAHRAIAQLRKATQAAKEASAPPDNGAPPAAAETAHETRPPPRVERVITTHVVTRFAGTRAFWERHYLGRPHMRAFR